MEQLKSEFLAELEIGLGKHPEKQAILQDYEAHLEELLSELSNSLSRDELETEMYSRFGTPKEIVAIWADELSVTPSRMKWLFIGLNLFFFAGGIGLTLAHHLIQWNWITFVWNQLTSIPLLIAFVYMFFWALLGYEIGKGFGHKGKRLMQVTFIIALIPNLLLMCLTVFELIPREWFHPLLTRTLITIYIGLTILLYPVCAISYHWGKKASL